MTLKNEGTGEGGHTRSGFHTILESGDRSRKREKDSITERRASVLFKELLLKGARSLVWKNPMAAAEHQVRGQVYSLFREPQRGIVLAPME